MNRGFKKVWLRKQFATLKYEDREKLMMEKAPDSSFSHSACQIVVEKEAESLKMIRIPEISRDNQSVPDGTSQNKWRYNI